MPSPWPSAPPSSKIRMNSFNTQIWPARGEYLARAAQYLKEGQLVVFPTETVYGLGANALDGKAVEKIFIAKGRPQDNPLICHISDVSQVAQVAHFLPAAQKLAEAFWPGPLTMVLPKKDTVPDVVTAGLNTVGVRCPGHEGARALISLAGVPIAAPSANLSGLPSPTKVAHAISDMSGRVPVILDGGDCRVGLESTVVSLVGDVPELLRPGGVTLTMLKSVLGEVNVAQGVLNPLPKGAKAHSPGMLHRHYAPQNAHVTVLCGTGDAILQRAREITTQNENTAFVAMHGLFARWQGKGGIDAGEDEAAYSARLFALLRELDEAGYTRILCQGTSGEGMGLALMNRLLRSAGFDVEVLG